MGEFHHVSVLLQECMEGLHIKPDGIYVDGTAGGGGHSYEIARRLTTGRLIAIDRDAAAIQAAKERLAPFSDRVTFVQNNFSNIKEVLLNLGINGVDGILLDLGVSSYQLDTQERGFSYHLEAPLDMRMNREQEKTAYDVVNTYEVSDLARVLRDYGEEKFALKIAKAIARARTSCPIETTTELAEIIKQAIPAPARREKGHPAKRSFQAIRIEVNDELGAVEQGVTDGIACLNPGGRIAVITFHSLEDRIVKSIFVKEGTGCICPKEFPVCVCGRKPNVTIITRKPVLPSQEELAVNHRSKSAKLRVAEKL